MESCTRYYCQKLAWSKKVINGNVLHKRKKKPKKTKKKPKTKNKQTTTTIKTNKQKQLKLKTNKYVIKQQHSQQPTQERTASILKNKAIKKGRLESQFKMTKMTLSSVTIPLVKYDDKIMMVKNSVF